MKASQPAWIPCPCCEEFICTIHLMHAFECDCPPIEEWDIDPYLEGGRDIKDFLREGVKSSLFFLRKY